MLITTTDVYQCHFNFAHGQPTCKALYSPRDGVKIEEEANSNPASKPYILPLHAISRTFHTIRIY